MAAHLQLHGPMPTAPKQDLRIRGDVLGVSSAERDAAAVRGSAPPLDPRMLPQFASLDSNDTNLEEVVVASDRGRTSQSPCPSAQSLGTLVLGERSPSPSRRESAQSSRTLVSQERSPSPLRRTSITSIDSVAFKELASLQLQGGADTLRATSSSWCLQFPTCVLCGGTLAGKDNQDFYHKSKVVEEVGAFWSHSWHATPWTKVATLLLHYKGLPAAMISILCSAAGGVFLCLLPWDAFKSWGFPGMITTVCGLTGFVCVVVLWRPSELVFLDKVCISQSDSTRKKHGIKSIGAILKASQRMVVLWDPTWARRLWCVFELAVAAALEKKLCILPVWLGPGVFFMVLWTFLLHLALFVTYAAEPDSAHMDSWSTVANQIVMLLLILIVS